MMQVEDLYYNIFPVFVPINFSGFLKEYILNKESLDGRTQNKYYYTVKDGDFYLLDKALCSFYRFDVKIVEEKMSYNVIEGKLFLLSKSEMDDIDYRLSKGYGKAFVYVDVFDVGRISSCIYFVGSKQRLKLFLYG